MRRPRVSFVVPCFRLGHLLGDCVTSILNQTYADFECLVMDDCSPDATAEVAQSFKDPRVIHIRNDVNIGHLANYNKGIELSRGAYVWLISADDRLRRPYVLERYVELLDSHPAAGYVFCPVVRFVGEQETTLYGSCGDRDKVMRGRDFLAQRLLHGNIVPAASGMVRRECYERLGQFPRDLPFAGDWYLWCLFALHHDVAYLAEPMVGWRDHSQNMTKSFLDRGRHLVGDELEVLWRALTLIESVRDRALGRVARQALADYAALRVAQKLGNPDAIGLTLEELETELDKHSDRSGILNEIRAAVYARLGDHHHGEGDFAAAKSFYSRALRCAPFDLRTVAKMTLLGFGPAGTRVRTMLSKREPH